MAQIRVVRCKNDWGDLTLEEYALAPDSWDLLAERSPERYQVLIVDERDLERHRDVATAWQAEQKRLAHL